MRRTPSLLATIALGSQHRSGRYDDSLGPPPILLLLSQMVVLGHSWSFDVSVISLAVVVVVVVVVVVLLVLVVLVCCR